MLAQTGEVRQPDGTAHAVDPAVIATGTVWHAPGTSSPSRLSTMAVVDHTGR